MMEGTQFKCSDAMRYSCNAGRYIAKTSEILSKLGSKKVQRFS